MEASNRHIINRISITSTLIIVLMFVSVILSAQADKKYIRQGNREYSREKFQDSEISYRKAIDDNKRSPDAVFNIGDALYKQNKYEEAAKQFSDNINMIDDNDKKAAGLYNLGNSFLQAKKLKESIEAFKGSLKLQPDNLEAKYNLAYAQDLLKEQEQKQQDQQDKNQENQDQKNDQDKQDDKQQNNDKKQDQQQNQQDQQKQQEQTISKEDAERLLNALANDEKNVQEKVKLDKAARARKSTVKNW